MCAILLSVNPEYSKMIFSGLKTIELRKKIGLHFDIGKKIYIYTTSPNKVISGEAVISDIRQGSPIGIKHLVLKQACVSSSFYDRYFRESNFAYAIYLRDIIEYKDKISISELRMFYMTPPQSFCYIKNTALLKKLNSWG